MSSAVTVSAALKPIADRRSQLTSRFLFEHAIRTGTDARLPDRLLARSPGNYTTPPARALSLVLLGAVGVSAIQPAEARFIAAQTSIGKRTDHSGSCNPMASLVSANQRITA
jgi:hypothetical protein